jgi:iron complex outermembrane recepter protein
MIFVLFSGSGLDVGRRFRPGTGRTVVRENHGAVDAPRLRCIAKTQTTSGDGRLKTLIGAYFFEESVFNINGLPLFTDIDANGDGILNHLDCEAALPVSCNFQNQFHQRKTSVAFYTDDSYKISDQLTLRGGLRFTHDKATLSGFTSQSFGTDGVLISNLIPGRATDLSATTGRGFTTNNVSPKIGIDYRTSSGTLLCATYSRGYRGGSFNGQSYFLPEELSTTKSETVSDYEIGSKTSLLDRRLELNTSVFYYDYKNQQFIDVDPATGAQPLVNLPLSRIFGAELEFAARPVRVLKITGGISLLDTRVKQGTLSDSSTTGWAIRARLVRPWRSSFDSSANAGRVPLRCRRHQAQLPGLV